MKILIVLAFALALAAISYGLYVREEKRQQGADAYERCVLAEYGTTPSAFYQKHGYYPRCN